MVFSKWNLIPRLIRICRIQWRILVFILSDLRRKYPFWVNLDLKIRIVSFSRSLVLRLIVIWTIQWLCSFFLFSIRGILYWEIYLKKIKIVCWSWNLEPRLTWICRTRWSFPFFFFLNEKHPFWLNLVEKLKIVTSARNLEPRLVQICKIWWYVYFYFSCFLQVFF